MPKYVLREKVSGKYLARWIEGFGPALGSEDEAIRFDSRDDALAHPACRHVLTFFEPRPTREPNSHSEPA